MAAFNPDIGATQMPDFTAASRGTGPNRSFEALFGGIAQTVQNVANVRDQQTQAQIQDDAEQMFDSVNSEFGVQPPGSMINELDRVQALQAALEQGKISEVNYYGRLANLSKQLRAKYPRYEQIVDQTIMSVTGTRPANAYRDAIFSEMNQIRQSATDEMKFRRQWEKENEGILSAVYGDDYFANPGQYDFDEVRMNVAKFKGGIETIDAEMKQLNLEAKRGELNDKKAERVMASYLSFTTEAELNKAIGANGKNFQQILDEFMANGAQDLETFTLEIGRAETTLRSRLLEAAQREFVSKGLVTQDQANKAVDAAMFPITEAKKAILGGEFKYAGRMATINKAISDRSLNDIFRKSPEAIVGAGLSELNKQFGYEYLEQNKIKLDQATDTLAKEAAGRAVGGMQKDILKSVVESGDQKLARGTVETFVDLLKEKKTQGTAMTNLVDQLFGPDAIDFMSPDVVSAEDLETIYTKFLDPEVTKAIKERGSPEDFEKYAKWATEKFLAIPAFRAVAGDAKSISALSKAEITYNPETNRIDIVAPVGENTLMDKLMGAGFRPFRRAVNALNKALAVLDPIAEGMGVKNDEFMIELLQNLSIDVEGGDGFFRMIEEAIRSSNTADGVEGEVLPEEEAPTTDLDFMSEEEEYDPLDEDVEEENPQAGPHAGLDRDVILTAYAAGNAGSAGRGLEALVPSRARGYDPDIENLRPEVVQGVIELQQLWGRPLPIVSGYRSPERNRKAGGARRSQHMHGNAVDIDVRNLSIEERKELIRMARQAGWGGIGVYPNSLHLDKGRTRSWGPNYRNNSVPKWARDVL